MVVQPSPQDPVRALVLALPERPPASADRALDAVSTCVARHGIARTSMTDVAREMGVARSTLYRQFGSVELAAWALLAREAYRFFDAFGDLVVREAGPRAVVELASEFIRFASTHPVLERLLQDEPDFVGQMITRHSAELVDYAAALVVPLVEAAMGAGMIRRRDPAQLAEWMGRIVAILIIAPPRGDLDALLEQMLLPLLEP
ncbi:MAG: TetR/AcrR family transcriptional regulator [Acidimicrobiales bacterium]